MNSRAFTLVELVVTIGLILVLAGLTLSVSVAIVHGSEVRQTETTLRLLDQAIREWEVQAGRQLTYGMNNASGDQFDIQEPFSHDPSLVEMEKATADFLAIISRSDAIKKILGQIDPDAMVRVENEFDPASSTIRILDAWGNGIVAVMPGRTWETGDTELRDADGTIQTHTEEDCGVAPNRQICFVSPGPDGHFGKLQAAQGSDELEQTKDNVLSVSQ